MVQLSESHFIHILPKVRSVSGPLLPIPSSIGDYMGTVVVVILRLKNETSLRMKQLKSLR